MKTQKTVLAGLLCAIGIVIPMFAPKIVIEPASFTLASHVPIFLAMFISPPVALFVVLGTTIGFFLSGLPVIIVLRALSHLVFAVIGAYWLQKFPPQNKFKTLLFGAAISLIHAVCEFIVVSFFYFGGIANPASYNSGFFISVVLLVFIGTFIHSFVDLTIAYTVAKPLARFKMFNASLHI